MQKYNETSAFYLFQIVVQRLAHLRLAQTLFLSVAVSSADYDLNRVTNKGLACEDD